MLKSGRHLSKHPADNFLTTHCICQLLTLSRKNNMNCDSHQLAKEPSINNSYGIIDMIFWIFCFVILNTSDIHFSTMDMARTLASISSSSSTLGTFQERRPYCPGLENLVRVNSNLDGKILYLHINTQLIIWMVLKEVKTIELFKFPNIASKNPKLHTFFRCDNIS